MPSSACARPLNLLLSRCRTPKALSNRAFQFVMSSQQVWRSRRGRNLEHPVPWCRVVRHRTAACDGLASICGVDAALRLHHQPLRHQRVVRGSYPASRRVPGVSPARIPRRLQGVDQRRGRGHGWPIPHPVYGQRLGLALTGRGIGPSDPGTLSVNPGYLDGSRPPSNALASIERELGHQFGSRSLYPLTIYGGSAFLIGLRCSLYGSSIRSVTYAPNTSTSSPSAQQRGMRAGFTSTSRHTWAPFRSSRRHKLTSCQANIWLHSRSCILVR